MSKKIVFTRKLAERLGMLKERRRQLDAEISELESSLDLLSGKGATAETAIPALIAEQILNIMSGSPDSTFGASDIERQMPGARSATIRAALSRLVREGQIVRVKRGMYAAKAV